MFISNHKANIVLLNLERDLWYFKVVAEKKKKTKFFFFLMLLHKADFGKVCAVRILMNCFTVKSRSIQLSFITVNNRDN